MKERLPIDQIVSDYKSGVSVTVISGRLGVSKETVYNRLRRAGVDIEAVRRDRVKRSAVAKARDRAERKAIKRELVERKAIRKERERVEVEAMTDQMVLDYKSGSRAKGLSIKYGVPESTIYYRLRRAGIFKASERPSLVSVDESPEYKEWRLR